MKRIALIAAAGVGARAGGEVPKQYQMIHGEPLLAHTLSAFSLSRMVDEIVVVVSENDAWISNVSMAPTCTLLRCGGATRAQTVRNALETLRHCYEENSWVLVHDAARCCITPALIEKLIAACERDEVGGLLALPVPDTVKRGDASSRVLETIDRNSLWLAQTPQMFRLGALLDALKIANNVTDEAGAMEAVGFVPLLVASSAQNFKVTFPEDFALAAALLKR